MITFAKFKQNIIFGFKFSYENIVLALGTRVLSTTIPMNLVNLSACLGHFKL